MSTLYEFGNAYHIDTSDHSLMWRDTTNNPISFTAEHPRDELMLFGAWATGIQSRDLAVFATAMNDDGCEELGFMVIQSSQHRGLLATPEVIEFDDSLMTVELAKKIATVSEEEIAQLGIESIIKRSREKYKNIRGFSR